eukprot:173564-Prymnesium_polylepis.1
MKTKRIGLAHNASLKSPVQYSTNGCMRRLVRRDLPLAHTHTHGSPVCGRPQRCGMADEQQRHRT